MTKPIEIKHSYLKRGERLVPLYSGVLSLESASMIEAYRKAKERALKEEKSKISSTCKPK